MKQDLLANLTKAFEKLNINVVQIDIATKEVIWIRDIYVPIDNYYIRCNITESSTMGRDRSNEFKQIVKYLDSNKKIINLPSYIKLEGGDVIQEGNYVFVGIGDRTNIRAVGFLKRLFPVKTFIPIYHSALHLDCVFCVLDDNIALYDSKYVSNLKLPSEFKKFDIADIVDSGVYLATNFVRVGKYIICSNARQNSKFRTILRDFGYNLILVDTKGIWKEGGSVRCLTQWL